MHLRRKPWMRKELLASPIFIVYPPENRGRWRESFLHPERPLHLDLGCGKGDFIARAGEMNPEINYVGVDLTDVVLAHARRKIDLKGLDNVKITAWDIERIDDIFSEEDKVDQITVNFCNPWPKRKQHKKRLVHPRRLIDYRKFLVEDGEIHFKTDDQELYEDALAYFPSCDFKILESTENLYEHLPKDNIQTEHEKMYLSLRKTIKQIIAVKK